MFTSPFPAITLHIAGGAFWSTLSLRPSYEMCSTDKLDLEIPFFLSVICQRLKYYTTKQQNEMYMASICFSMLMIVLVIFCWSWWSLAFSGLCLYWASLRCEFCINALVELKKNSMQHAERTLPWINRGSEMCEKGHPHLRGEQRSVPFIFSVLWRSWMNAHRSGLKVNLV